MYSYAIIGSGMMGEAAAYDLLQSKDTEKVLLIDYNKEQAKKVAEKLNNSRVIFQRADASNEKEMTKILRDYDAAIGSAGYKYNFILTKAAINSKTHFVDMGGNNTIVEKQFSLDEVAKKERVKILPDFGIAPGAVSTIVVLGIEELGIPDNVKIMVGGLPQIPYGPLKYMKVFSVEGLVNEYKEDVEILKGGNLLKVQSLGGLEDVLIENKNFENKKLLLEAAYTSGGSSTLAKTYKGKIEELSYKTLRYPGHWQKIRDMRDLGFFDEDVRKTTEKIIDKNISYKEKDMLIVRVVLEKENKKLIYDVVDLENEETGHTSMQRTTAYSTAIAAQMMAKGIIEENGVLYIEKSVPPVQFVNEWEKRGIILDKKYL